MIVADTVNSNLINICLRFKATVHEQPKPDRKRTWAQRLYSASNAIEWILRISILAISLMQLLINHSNQGAGCLKQPDGVLANESNYLALIVVIQVGKVTVFTAWSLKLSKASDRVSQDRKPGK